MRKIALAAVLALASLSGVAHAIGPTHNPGIVAPTPGQLAQFLAGAKMTKIKFSSSANSQYVKFNKALTTKPGSFTTLNFGMSGPDFGRTAYIPKLSIKGLKTNTAYVMEQSIIGAHLVGKIALPVF